MRVLITGINGFVGGHLAEHLLFSGGWEITGVSRSTRLNLPHLHGAVELAQVNLDEAEATAALLARSEPQVIFHLAGQTFVPASFRDPAATLQTNILGLLNILLAVQAQGRDCRVLVVGSNEEYGMVQPHDIPIDEDTPLRPASPYGVSKVAQGLLALQYYQSHGLDVVRVRPFNHIGPRQSERFVASAFARQIVEIEKGQHPPVLKVGNLDVLRDFTDVRDMVRAYVLAVQSGESGAVYNLGSGKPIAIRTLLDMLTTASHANFTVQPDPERMRPVNVPVVACDTRRFRALTGWQPRIPLEQTMQDILAEWRSTIDDSPVHEEPSPAHTPEPAADSSKQDKNP